MVTNPEKGVRLHEILFGSRPCRVMYLHIIKTVTLAPARNFHTPGVYNKIVYEILDITYYW